MHPIPIKRIGILVSPLLLFFILVVPYSYANSKFIVDWLGCGCPQIDENGIIIEHYLNANDFTACFWMFITICVTVISGFLSKLLPKKNLGIQGLYIFGMFAISLFISYQFIQVMMWN